MKLTRGEIEGVATGRILYNYRKRTIKIMIIYLFGLAAITLPLSLETRLGSWIFFLGLVTMLMLYTFFYYYRIKPKAKRLGKKMFDEMLLEEQMMPESGPVDSRNVASIDEAE